MEHYLIPDIAAYIAEHPVVSLADVLKEHRSRFVILSSRGTIVLRHISRIDHAAAQLRRAKSNPDYDRLSERLDYFVSVLNAGYTLTDTLRSEYESVIDAIRPPVWEIHALCFQSPAITTEEEYKALLDSLNATEAEQLMLMLASLTAPADISDSDSRTIAMCQKHGIPISGDLTVENMTLNQGALMDKVASEERAADDELMSRIERSINGRSPVHV